MSEANERLISACNKLNDRIKTLDPMTNIANLEEYKTFQYALLNFRLLKANNNENS